MMHNLGINLKITAKVEELVATLKTNREAHARMVAEARAGYLVEAKKQVQERLALLEQEKAVDLNFKLKVPKDFTNIYDTAIGMLERHSGTTVELGPDEFRHLVEDNWDWLRDFVETNYSYSNSTRNFGVGKGLDVR